jgi:hypothetical protein
MALDESTACLGCGKPITGRRPHALYCSASCKQRSYRGRLEVQAIENARALEEAKRAEAHARVRQDFIASLIG